jgi:hypothetical protein
VTTAPAPLVRCFETTRHDWHSHCQYDRTGVLQLVWCVGEDPHFRACRGRTVAEEQALVRRPAYLAYLLGLEPETS